MKNINKLFRQTFFKTASPSPKSGLTIKVAARIVLEKAEATPNEPEF